MAKSLSERIAERAAKKKPSRNAQNRAAFLALRGDIKQALDDGWPVKSIWETLHEENKVAFSYQAFRGYTNRLILSRTSSTEPAPAIDQRKVEKPQTVATTKVSTEEKIVKPAGIGGFKFESEAKKEDLL